MERNLPHGHVEAVLGFMSKLGVDRLLASRRWDSTTLAQELEVAGAGENKRYQALDWLLSRKNRIEGKLAKRHLRKGAAGGVVRRDLQHVLRADVSVGGARVWSVYKGEPVARTASPWETSASLLDFFCLCSGFSALAGYYVMHFT